MVRLPLPAAQRRVLARRGVQPVVAAAAATFVGVSGEPLAMVLVAREATGSFATAGLVVAAYALTAGLLAPLRGRALDRRGGRMIVPIAGWDLGARPWRSQRHAPRAPGSRLGPQRRRVA